MPLLEPLYNIVELCALHGIKEAIICPGSRSAALTLAFARNTRINTRVIADERSAAFVALGMALQSGETVALVCTSGSAAFNFAPAVAEAYFQELPLLILTADRPPEWIHQYDGQTIFQKDIYGRHVKKTFDLPVDYTHKDAQWQVERVTNEAAALAQTSPKGPVHINVPIREPFYPEGNERVFPIVRKVEFLQKSAVLAPAAWSDLMDIWQKTERKLIAIGQNKEDLDDELGGLIAEEGVVVLADIISNVNIDEKISSQDVFLGKVGDSKPDLLITAGKSFISKTFKQYIRKNKPTYHWHIQEHPDLIDPTQSLSHKIEVSPKYFFKELLETLDMKKLKTGDEDEENDYFLEWNSLEEISVRYLNKFLNNVDFGELKATSMLLESLSSEFVLHLGNSMPVRYANLLGGLSKERFEVSSNRGTSGIDGIVSTAIGQALKTYKTVVCLVGDVSFFYDSNALFYGELPQNLRIVLLNNGGGNIFRIIDGPSKQEELESHFVTHQGRTAESLAKESGIRYLKASNMIEMAEGLDIMIKGDPRAALLEVFTDGQADAEIFKALKTGFTL
ncbi:2-succinyl-5-enolpyruvyl-6-hydroxy-3-cyclohexene-1-carboxylic-acid synthase [Lacihabitans sp. CCS-44]|uniref:2-succinyl-5-enolpyruvyl-6-hydroxy-3- cyclohexene-1-carboxylic-acid synthase n=1 Tax=Lacihabitans sp. CCS-44 TaxID=2487331 RepID=UPI0020CB9190|nr:2-succinyl-5-enolpyruvyl-6-hydroxy-3-cyclohexene-1-carboxylic-acid synthase [Lacihabitans sp. CCS-44]MCP9757376.1 2-succinyl-5-enolpyruvyl-6-hydroxy-3-cyclohexene-1-carboxylic-acid synthase [Lacihabitans sp. CCS-44]